MSSHITMVHMGDGIVHVENYSGALTVQGEVSCEIQHNHLDLPAGADAAKESINITIRVHTRGPIEYHGIGELEAENENKTERIIK